MKREGHNEERLVQYLMGQLRPEEQAALEEQYLADPDLHEELRATERDLIDQYVHGELSNRDQFERYFLASPRRRQKVEFARALMESAGRSQTVTVPTRSIAMRESRWSPILDFIGRPRVWIPVMAAVVIVVALLLIVSRQNPARPEPNAQNPAQPPTQVSPGTTVPAPNVPVPSPSTPTPPSLTAAFVLSPGLVRSADETQTLSFPGNAEVSLELHFEPGDYETYRVTLRTAEGEQLWTQDKLKPRNTSAGDAITVRIPASRFNDRDYTVRLSGITASGDAEDVSSYYFRVKKN
jgi:hypothetical protein